MMQQQKAAPYKVDQERPVNNYKVLDNGEIEIIQVITTTSVWKPRDFISLLRENEKALEDTKFHLSDEYKKLMEDQVKEIKAEIKILKPLKEDSEVKAKIAYEKMRDDGLLAGVQARLDTKEGIDNTWFQSIWMPLNDEIRENIVSKLSEDEKIQLMKIIGKLKKKGVVIKNA